MKSSIQALPFGLLMALSFSASSAEERRNQYTNSIMFSAPELYEDPQHKTVEEQRQQYCQALRKKISDLANRPIRKNAANERYRAECVGN